MRQAAMGGNRASRLATARNKDKAAFESAKTEMETETNKINVKAVDDRFNSTNNNVEQQLAQATVGLVSKAEFARRREAIEHTAEASEVRWHLQDGCDMYVELLRAEWACCRPVVHHELQLKPTSGD